MCDIVKQIKDSEMKCSQCDNEAVWGCSECKYYYCDNCIGRVCENCYRIADRPIVKYLVETIKRTGRKTFAQETFPTKKTVECENIEKWMLSFKGVYRIKQIKEATLFVQAIPSHPIVYKIVQREIDAIPFPANVFVTVEKI